MGVECTNERLTVQGCNGRKGVEPGAGWAGCSQSQRGDGYNSRVGMKEVD